MDYIIARKYICLTLHVNHPWPLAVVARADRSLIPITSGGCYIGCPWHNKLVCVGVCHRYIP